MSGKNIKGTKAEPGSPFYLPSNALPGTALTPTKLVGDNYIQWEQDALLALLFMNKLGFINITIPYTRQLRP